MVLGTAEAVPLVLVLELAALALVADLAVELVEALNDVRVVVEPRAPGLVGDLDGSELLDDLFTSACELVGSGCA